MLPQHCGKYDSTIYRQGYSQYGPWMLFWAAGELSATATTIEQRRLSVMIEGKKWPGGAEKARMKNRKALEEDAAKCAKVRDLFSQGQSQVASGKEI